MSKEIRDQLVAEADSWLIKAREAVSDFQGQGSYDRNPGCIQEARDCAERGLHRLADAWKMVEA